MKQNDELLRGARRAYERGRIQKALRTSMLAAPMMVASFGGCSTPGVAVALASVLAVVSGVLVWRGGSAGRGVLPGFVAGALPLVVTLVGCTAFERAGVTGAIPLVVCVVAGILSGAIIASFASREREHRAVFVAAAGAVAALAGSLGCVIVGLGGVAAMAAGLVLVAPLGVRRARGA